MKKISLCVVSILLLACVGTYAEEVKSVDLFNGKNLSQWTPLHDNSKWQVVGEVDLSEQNNKLFDFKSGQGIMVNGKDGRTSNLLTKYAHGDCQLHIEFMVPKGSNSGVYLQSLYEIQVLDSYGKENVKYSDCGGIYQRWDEKNNKPLDQGEAPYVNASKAPGEWQAFDITFRAPRFDEEGNMTENPRFVLVIHNGRIVHEDFELLGPTRAYNRKQKPAPKAPLMLQGDHGPVAYRNIRLIPLHLDVDGKKPSAANLRKMR
ncbi:DUF1080 domain-containing protein [bacterium]|nr:DUF1080 domain-containing protein [bacterium]